MSRLDRERSVTDQLMCEEYRFGLFRFQARIDIRARGSASQECIRTKKPKKEQEDQCNWMQNRAVFQPDIILRVSIILIQFLTTPAASTHSSSFIQSKFLVKRRRNSDNTVSQTALGILIYTSIGSDTQFAVLFSMPQLHYVFK